MGALVQIDRHQHQRRWLVLQETRSVSFGVKVRVRVRARARPRVRVGAAPCVATAAADSCGRIPLITSSREVCVAALLHVLLQRGRLQRTCVPIIIGLSCAPLGRKSPARYRLKP